MSSNNSKNESKKAIRTIVNKGIGLFHTGGSFTRGSSKNLSSEAKPSVTLEQFMQKVNREKESKSTDRDRIEKPCKMHNTSQNKILLLKSDEHRNFDNYWENRVEKLRNQTPDLGVYGKLDIVKNGTLIDEGGKMQVKQIFKGYSFYFNGLTTASCGKENNLSQTNMAHLATLHGAVVLPYLAKKKLTHIICENVCQSKQERVLTLKKGLKFSSVRVVDGVAMNISALHYVKPSWLIESIKNGCALPELQYSTMSDHTARTLSDFTPK